MSSVSSAGLLDYLWIGNSGFAKGGKNKNKINDEQQQRAYNRMLKEHADIAKKQKMVNESAAKEVREAEEKRVQQTEGQKPVSQAKAPNTAGSEDVPFKTWSDIYETYDDYKHAMDEYVVEMKRNEADNRAYRDEALRTGNKVTLTEEQKRELSEKYDFNNMKYPEYWDFIDDLCSYGVMRDTDRYYIKGASMTPLEYTRTGAWTTPTAGTKFDYDDLEKGCDLLGYAKYFSGEKERAAGGGQVQTWSGVLYERVAKVIEQVASEVPAEQVTKSAASCETTILPTDTTEVKLSKLREIADKSDYSGMSYSEIYTDIWNRYNDAFDGNLEAICSIMTEGRQWNDINNQFAYEAAKFVYKPLINEMEKRSIYSRDEKAFEDFIQPTLDEIASAPLGYSGMSYEEKEAAIREKYAGKDTLIDFLNMQGELKRTGVIKHKMGEADGEYTLILRNQIKKNYFYDDYMSTGDISNEQWDALLNSNPKMDFRSFYMDVKQSLPRYSFSGYSFDVGELMNSVIDECIDKLGRASQDSYVPNTKAQSSGAEADPIIIPSYVSEGTRAKLIELARINRQADYTGMSYDEIYAEIWNRYNEAFEGNMIAIYGLVAGPAEWSVISSKFEDELEEHIVKPEMDLRKAMSGKTSYTPEENSDLSGEIYHDCVYKARLKVLGYEGMNIDEIEAAIKEKYAGKNNVQDFVNMQSELHRTGVLRHKMGILGMRSYIRMITHQFVRACNPQYISDIHNGGVYGMSPEQWNRVADQPFDAAGFASKMREMLGNMRFEGYPVNIEDIILSAIDEFISEEK